MSTDIPPQDTSPTAVSTRGTMVADGVEVLRCSDMPPATFLVLGERCSGTNFLQALIRDNFPLKGWQANIWKHGFPGFHAVPERTILVVTWRNAVPWVRSLYERPWHVTRTMREMSFGTFIRAEWNTVVDDHYMGGKFRGRALLGRPLLQDRDPVTGQMFANLFRMRTAKLNGLNSLRGVGANVVFARHEAVAGNPGAFVSGLGRAFDLEHPGTVVTRAKRMGGIDAWAKRTKAPPEVLAEADLDFMTSQLDLDLEARLGYSY